MRSLRRMSLATRARRRPHRAPVRVGCPVLLVVLAACVLGCGAAPPPAPLTGMRAEWACGEASGDLERDVREAIECEQQRWRDDYSEIHEVPVLDVTLHADVKRWIWRALRQLAVARPAPASGDAIQRLVADAELWAPDGVSMDGVSITGIFGLVVSKTVVSAPPMLVDVVPDCRRRGCELSVRPHMPVRDEPHERSYRVWTQECELCLPVAFEQDEPYWRAAKVGDLVDFDRRSARERACGNRWLDLDPEECPFPVES